MGIKKVEVVLDTVCLSHLLRRPAKNRSGVTGTALDTSIENKRLTLVLDAGTALLSEWIETCGEEAVMTTVAKWEPLGGVRFVVDVPEIPSAVFARLRRAGFVGTMDKIVLRLGMASGDRMVVSNDHRFWDRDTRRRGDPRGEIASLCLTELDVTVLLLKQLMRQLAA